MVCAKVPLGTSTRPTPTPDEGRSKSTERPPFAARSDSSSSNQPPQRVHQGGGLHATGQNPAQSGIHGPKGQPAAVERVGQSLPLRSAAEQAAQGPGPTAPPRRRFLRAWARATRNRPRRPSGTEGRHGQRTTGNGACPGQAIQAPAPPGRLRLRERSDATPRLRPTG